MISSWRLARAIQKIAVPARPKPARVRGGSRRVGFPAPGKGDGQGDDDDPAGQGSTKSRDQVKDEVDGEPQIDGPITSP